MQSFETTFTIEDEDKGLCIAQLFIKIELDCGVRLDFDATAHFDLKAKERRSTKDDHTVQHYQDFLDGTRNDIVFSETKHGTTFISRLKDKIHFDCSHYGGSCFALPEVMCSKLLIDLVQKRVDLNKHEISE